jgi:hypothetical protein
LDGHYYAATTSYPYPPMPPPPNHGAANGGPACKLNPASWDGADHDWQRVYNIPRPPNSYVPCSRAYPEYPSHAHEGGFSEPSVWPSPSYGPAP